MQYVIKWDKKEPFKVVVEMYVEWQSGLHYFTRENEDRL